MKIVYMKLNVTQPSLVSLILSFLQRNRKEMKQFKRVLQHFKKAPVENKIKRMKWMKSDGLKNGLCCPNNVTIKLGIKDRFERSFAGLFSAIAPPPTLDV